MRVTLVSALLDLSGGSRVIATYARMLVEHGHRVTVVAPVRRKRTLRQKLRGLLATGRWEREARHGSHYDGLGLDVRMIDHRPMVEADVPDADVIVATWWETAEWINALSPRKGAKVYFVQGHETFDVQHIERVRATYHMPFLKIVISGWLQRIMKDVYGDANTVLVPNSVDHAVFFAEPRDKRPVPTIGFLYSEGGVKAIEVAIEAIRRVKQRMPALRVVSFGTREPRNIAGLQDAFEFCLLPDGRQLRQAYSACDVWICSSRSEGFGLPAMEAMACRTPVVSTRVGWPLDAIEDGRNGYLVPIDDPQALADAAWRILTLEPAAWRAMSEAAQRTAHAYRWDKSYALFVAALEQARNSQAAVA